MKRRVIHASALVSRFTDPAQCGALPPPPGTRARTPRDLRLRPSHRKHQHTTDQHSSMTSGPLTARVLPSFSCVIRLYTNGRPDSSTRRIQLSAATATITFLNCSDERPAVLCRSCTVLNASSNFCSKPSSPRFWCHGGWRHEAGGRAAARAGGYVRRTNRIVRRIIAKAIMH